MRILILSKEAWRDEQNGGNVLSNIFKGFDAEFAQIYCNECLPNNKICRLYYQITDKDMVRSLIGKGRAGRKIKYDSLPENKTATTESFNSGKRWLKSLMPIFRELAWWLGRWNEKEMLEFVNDFNPDIIFAPCYGNHYMHKLTRLIHRTANVNVISYISDDHYSNCQLRFEPWFWINHFLLRTHTRDIFKHYSLVYTMTEKQKLQCEKNFGASMKILCKAGEFSSGIEKKKVNKPIRIVYAGGIYLNRWRTLKLLADAIGRIDGTGNNFRLDIYTNNRLTAEMSAALNRDGFSEVHSVVSSEKLKKIYLASDIALHCESFDLMNRLKVRLSFSTKIVDCLDSGCAVMAICDSEQAGYVYLKCNDAAICISNPTDIEPTLRHLLEIPNEIIEYQHKAFRLGRKNHLSSQINQTILNDFNNLSR